MIKACIFDLDGVIVDTARYHFLAWSRLAKELNIPFTEKDNERLKGVSRVESLDILLSLGKGPALDQSTREKLAAQKNEWFVEYILYHEILHIKHPARLIKGRRYYHTSAFRLDERRFPHYEQAQRWLEQLARQRRVPRARAA